MMKALVLLSVLVLQAQAQTSGDVRLVDSSSTTAQAGRLEIFWKGKWGRVCADGFGKTEAKIVCRNLGSMDPYKVGGVGELGFSDALNTSTVIWLEWVSCQGNENSLLSCSYTYSLLDGGLLHCSNNSPEVAIKCTSFITLLQVTVVIVIVVTLSCVACVLCVCVYKKRKGNSSVPYQQFTSTAQQNSRESSL